MKVLSQNCLVFFFFFFFSSAEEEDTILKVLISCFCCSFSFLGLVSLKVLPGKTIEPTYINVQPTVARNPQVSALVLRAFGRFSQPLQQSGRQSPANQNR